MGHSGETLPSHVGIPLGEAFGGATYFMLETHYDNPALHHSVTDSSGVRIFYTDRVRRYDASMLLLGSEVNFLHAIPPAQTAFRTIGRCTSECTRKVRGKLLVIIPPIFDFLPLLLLLFFLRCSCSCCFPLLIHY